MKKSDSGISRRDFIRTSSVVTAGVMASGCGIFDKKRKKPNLLFIWTDEQRFDTFAVYGNKKIKAPNLNRLASQSFVFKKAYVTQAVSTSSRCSVMTGLYPHVTGLHTNNIPLPKDVRCFPELLNDPEYRTGYMGKWHLGDELFPQHGFDTWISIEDIYNDYFSEGKDRNTRSSYHHWLVEKGYEPNMDKIFGRGFATRLPIEHCKPRFLEEKACEFIETHKNEPFVLYVNFLEPHMPFNGPLNDIHDDAIVELPANYNDPLDDTEPERYHRQRESNIKVYGPGEAEFKRVIRNYWGMVTQLDMSVGAILDKVEQLGLADDTIVVFTSDHGDMMGSHKMMTKTVMFEESARVPFMIKAPFIKESQTVIEEPMSHIDIVPTLLDMMGKDIPGNLNGKSLLPLLKGKKMPEDYVVVEWNSKNYNDRTVVSPDGWKLSLRDTDKNTLYNLNDDPLETTNLYPDPAYREKIKFLEEKIREWQMRVKDVVKVEATI
jgi:arylsulfatase A-like enzyme